MRTYARPYRSTLMVGCVWTVGVVLARLALPWPLRGVVETVFPMGQTGSATLVSYLPASGDPVLWLGALYLATAALAGAAEMAQRIAMMKFAARTVHDMRAAAVVGATREAMRRGRAGDLIARVVGDAARIKAGTSGILVHVTQNGLLFLGVCTVFLVIAPVLGFFFLVAGALAVSIGWYSSESVGRSAHKHRQMEGDYAATVEEAIAQGDLDADVDELNLGSAQKDVQTTRLITRSTLLIHIVLASTVMLALWVGASQVAAGMLAPGDIFLFIAYALTVHRRTVQLGRQTARSGKVLACANRLGVLLETAQAEPAARPTALVESLQLEGVRCRSTRGRGDRARLKTTDLTLCAGEHVVVLGELGAGKSTLLRAIAGVESARRGTVRWDGTDVSHNGVLRAGVAYVPESPVFPTRLLWKTLGLSTAESPQRKQRKTLRRFGIKKLISRLPKGLRTKLSSGDVTGNEARLLALASLSFKSRAPVWVLDSPVDGLDRKASRRAVRELLSRAKERTLVVALSRPVELDRFDRIIGMRKGAVVFDGSPAQWRSRKAVPIRAEAV